MQTQLPVFVFKEMIEWELRRLFSEDIFEPMSFKKWAACIFAVTNNCIFSSLIFITKSGGSFGQLYRCKSFIKLDISRAYTISKVRYCYLLQPSRDVPKVQILAVILNQSLPNSALRTPDIQMNIWLFQMERCFVAYARKTFPLKLA